MSRHLSDQSLALIHTQLSGAIIKTPGAWVYDHRGRAMCDGHDLICALDELRRRRQNSQLKGSFRLGKTSSLLMVMKVGEEVEVEPLTQGALTSARKTARRRMGIPDAVWHSVTQPNGLILIRRMPDGSEPHASYRNPAVFLMAKMNVGDTLILTTVKGKMHIQLKAHARRIMDNSAANWRCQNLADGNIRCVRSR